MGLNFLAFWAAPAIAAGAEIAFARETAAWRAERVAALTKADGWLSLIGLHFLKDGANRVGSAKDNEVVLAAGPARAGEVTLGADGAVSFVPEPAVGALVDGKSVAQAVLKAGEGVVKPTLVAVGTVSFFVIERGGKKALRVKNSESERRAQFVGIDYFPIEPSWSIAARWVEFEKSRQIPLTNILGQVSPALVPGKAVFEWEGKTYELLAIDEGPHEPLFFVISDATSGKETYAAARFIYAERAKDGKIVLDFNRAENPPCAFTPFATCPLPPKENRLPFAVTAGERNYRGRHD
jgi:uncharacterized protein (DUF1684 family)